MTNMKKFKYTITDELGIHARPAGLLVKAASGFQSEITLEKEGRSASAKKLFAIMSLGARKGSVIQVTVEGPDEDTAAEAVKQFLEENL